MLRTEHALNRAARAVFEVRTWHVALAALGAFVLLTAFAPNGAFLLAMAVLAATAIYWWVHQFLYLMGLRDEDLPGRFDKPVWAFLMIVAPPVGLLMFMAFQRGRAATAKPEPTELS